MSKYRLSNALSPDPYGPMKEQNLLTDVPMAIAKFGAPRLESIEAM